MSTRAAGGDGARRLTIRPVSPARWDDVVDLFGTRGAPSWCWCQYFLTTGEGYFMATDTNREALRAQVGSGAKGRSRGLVAYAGDESVGWVQLGPRTAYPRITTNRGRAALATETGDDLADGDVWSVTCFVVRVGHRRKGIARALLGAAVDFAREQGARALEGHPVEVAARASGKAPGSDLYHGVASTFSDAGFTEVGRTGPTRPLMRMPL